MTDIVWLVALAALIVLWIVRDERQQARFSAELTKQAEEWRSAWRKDREEWADERQRLLDRIQAPSFAEYKQAEVKTIRAKSGEPPVGPPLIPM